MKRIRSLMLLALALSTHGALAAEQAVPTDSSLHVQADAALTKLLPADIAKRGFIVAGTNPNTPPTT